MSDLLKKAEQELRQLYQAIVSLSDEQAKEELITKAAQLNFHQETAVMNLLEKTDKAYDTLVQENFDLLINTMIMITVSHEDTAIFPSHALILDGGLREDGLFHAHTAETNATFLSFYPLSYAGLMNYFGEAELYLDKKRTTFIGSKVPLKFKGSINSKGALHIEATEIGEVHQGKKYVNHIIADLFSGNASRREQFLNNKLLLKQIITDFRSKL